MLPTPLTSLLDSVSVGSSSQRTRESPCSAGKHCQRCSSHQSSQHVTQPALCCGFVLNYSSSPLSQGSGQQTSSAPSHLGCFHQPFPLDLCARRSCVLPVLAVTFGRGAGCQPSGTGAARPGTLLLLAAVGWSQKIHGKLGELVVLLCVSVVEHDFSVSAFFFLFRVGLNIWYSYILEK